MKPQRVDAATRASLALLSQLCDWRSCLVVVRPETVLRWHRAGWRLFWRCKSRTDRPPRFVANCGDCRGSPLGYPVRGKRSGAQWTVKGYKSAYLGICSPRALRANLIILREIVTSRAPDC